MLKLCKKPAGSEKQPSDTPCKLVQRNSPRSAYIMLNGKYLVGMSQKQNENSDSILRALMDRLKTESFTKEEAKAWVREQSRAG